MSAQPPIRVATRRSELAITQCVQVMESLHKATGRAIEIYPMSSLGDDNPDKALNSFDRKGLFVHEIREGVLSGEFDLAVHSLKDVPTQEAPGLTISSIPVRGNAKDLLVTSQRLPVTSIIDLPHNAVVGTSSLRRQYQITAMRSDLSFLPIRGNVPTRMRKTINDLDAVILAYAGVNRLQHGAACLPEVRITAEGLANMPEDFSLAKLGLVPAADGSVCAGDILTGSQQLADLHVNKHRIPYYHIVSAPGQGALALEHRTDDTLMRDLTAKLSDLATELTITFERTVLREIEGGCSTPLGVFANLVGTKMAVEGFLASPDGTKRATLRRVFDVTDMDSVVANAQAYAYQLQGSLV